MLQGNSAKSSGRRVAVSRVSDRRTATPLVVSVSDILFLLLTAIAITADTTTTTATTTAIAAAAAAASFDYSLALLLLLTGLSLLLPFCLPLLRRLLSCPPSPAHPPSPPNTPTPFCLFVCFCISLVCKTV